MQLINEIEALTIRKGKLISVSIIDVNKPIDEWNWADESCYGFGTRAYAYQSADLGHFHEINIGWDNIWKASLKKKPKTIKGDFIPNRKKKTSFRVIHGNVSLEINKIYRLYFEDQLTGKRFAVNNYEILETIQPGMVCQAYWSFNPYAVFGTGFQSWSNPNRVFTYDLDMKFTIKNRTDYIMVAAVQSKERNLENLSRYTGIEF